MSSFSYFYNVSGSSNFADTILPQTPPTNVIDLREQASQFNLDVQHRPYYKSINRYALHLEQYFLFLFYITSFTD